MHQKVANQNEENEGDEDSAPSLQASRPGEAVAGKENDHDRARRLASIHTHPKAQDLT